MMLVPIDRTEDSYFPNSKEFLNFRHVFGSARLSIKLQPTLARPVDRNAQNAKKRILGLQHKPKNMRLSLEKGHF